MLFSLNVSRTTMGINVGFPKQLHARFFTGEAGEQTWQQKLKTKPKMVINKETIPILFKHQAAVPFNMSLLWVKR